MKKHFKKVQNVVGVMVGTISPKETLDYFELLSLMLIVEAKSSRLQLRRVKAARLTFITSKKMLMMRRGL